jgi:hypothetical protein
MALTGGCFCGRVRYQLSAPLLGAISCHCSRCRKAFSGAGSAFARVAPGSFSWTSGADGVTRYDSAAGPGLAFCSSCGTTLGGTFNGDMMGVTLGSVDGDAGVDIGMHIYVGSKAAWDHIAGSAPCYDAAPPAGGA